VLLSGEKTQKHNIDFRENEERGGGGGGGTEPQLRKKLHTPKNLKEGKKSLRPGEASLKKGTEKEKEKDRGTKFGRASSRDHKG